jgi:hypothetical protein
LYFADGQEFATGAIVYAYHPASAWETTPRIIVDILIGGLRTSAFVDTGGIYLICSPSIASSLQFHPDDRLFTSRLLIRGQWLHGSLYRMPLTFPASTGYSLTIDTLAFLPDAGDSWFADVPCILGMQGCLERLRFAIDPSYDTFYFGALV